MNRFGQHLLGLWAFLRTGRLAWVQLVAKRRSQSERREKLTDNAGISAEVDALDP
jgi:hypothetical protein